MEEERGKRAGGWQALPSPGLHMCLLGLPGLLSRSSRGSQAEITFPGSSQGRSGRCWDMWAVPTCCLTQPHSKPAPSG